MRTRISLGSVCAAVVLGSMPGAAVAQQGDLAIVYRLMLDERMVVVPNAGTETAAELGRRLNDRDYVATSENTRAAIRFADDGSLVRLNPSSEMLLRGEGDRNALVKTIELEFGEVWARVTRGQGANFRVQTPSGVAAVKGTEFIVRVGLDGVTTVMTLDGIVEFFNDAGRVDVTRGNLVIVGSMTDPPRTRPITNSDMLGLTDLIEDGAGRIEDERVEVEVRLIDAEGRERILLIELPRSGARSILGGGL